MTIAGPIATLLEMAALNNGFDRELPIVDGWLAGGAWAFFCWEIARRLQSRGAIEKPD